MENENVLLKKLVRIFLPITAVFIVIILVVTVIPKNNKVVIAKVLEKAPTASSSKKEEDSSQKSEDSTVKDNNNESVQEAPQPAVTEDMPQTTDTVSQQPAETTDVGLINDYSMEQEEKKAEANNSNVDETTDEDITEDIDYEEEDAEIIEDENEEASNNDSQNTPNNNQSTTNNATNNNTTAENSTITNDNKQTTTSKTTNSSSKTTTTKKKTTKKTTTNKNTFTNFSHLNRYNQTGKYGNYSVCASGGNSIRNTACGLSSYMAARYVVTRKDTNILAFAHEACNTGFYNGLGATWQVVDGKTYQNKYGMKSVAIKNNYKTIVNELKKGHPVVVMIGYGSRTIERGGFNGTSNLHYIVLVKYNDKKDQIYVYNPTGENTGWASKSRIQKYVINCGKLIRSMRKA